jgi:putative FmdB family regulatory protein
MPLYEYECVNCKERVEIIQRLNDPPSPHCPKCDADMRKLISSPAIQFKGSGFYKTDYTPSKSTESKSESKSESTTTTKSETKSESKAD